MSPGEEADAAAERLQALVERKLMESFEKEAALREKDRVWGRLVTALIVIIFLLLIFW
jgi:hypothetical protein